MSPDLTSSKTITLPDGRRLGYSDYGEMNGQPVFYFPGGIGTRLQIRPDLLSTPQACVRLISIDRPGLGLSDFKPGRKIVDWPDDVLALAGALQFGRFGVIGVSSGGAYALACARKIPGRLTSCGLVASATPVDLIEDEGKTIRAMLGFYRKHPVLLKAWLWWMYGRYIGKGEAVMEKILARPARVPKTFAERDRRLWEDPAFRRHEWADHLEALRQGTRGPAYEMGLWGGDWGFSLEEITYEKIHVWHGAQDFNSPVSAVRRMLAKIPHQSVEIFPEDGHSVGSYHWAEILERMASSE